MAHLAFLRVNQHSSIESRYQHAEVIRSHFFSNLRCKQGIILKITLFLLRSSLLICVILSKKTKTIVILNTSHLQPHPDTLRYQKAHPIQYDLRALGMSYRSVISGKSLASSSLTSSTSLSDSTSASLSFGFIALLTTT